MIHFFLSLIYADTQELGWDSSVVSLDDDDQYDIRVDGFDGTTQTYRTLKLLSGSTLEDVRDGGTRVWKAVRIEDGEECGEAVVLKDAWADADLMAEGLILDKIRGFDCEPEKRDYIDTHFPTLLFHGDVFLDPGRTTLDCARSLSPATNGFVDSADIARTRLSVSSGEHLKLDPKASEPTEYGRVHYRIVMKEVGRAISRQDSPIVIFAMLAQVVFGKSASHCSGTLCSQKHVAALRYMHQSGWVHHDISLGNIAIVKNRAMLLDLEYAQKAGQEGDWCIVSIISLR